MVRTAAGMMGFALALAVWTPLAAQTADVLAAKTVVCTPERMTSCDAAGKCETVDATPADKTDLMTIDFAGGKASTPRDTRLGEVTNDRVEGGMRKFAIRSPDNQSMEVSLSRTGKFQATMGRRKMEAVCKPGS